MFYYSHGRFGNLNMVNLECGQRTVIMAIWKFDHGRRILTLVELVNRCQMLKRPMVNNNAFFLLLL